MTSMITSGMLRTLAETRKPGSISIYLPTHRFGPETEQDPIRLKNLLAKAEERALVYGLDKRTVRAALAPAGALLDDAEFWRYQGEGLAILISPDAEHRYRLSSPVDEVAYVGDRFCVRPLVRAVTRGQRFCVLALSQNAIRLLDCSRTSAREVDLHDIPESLEQSVGYDYEERSLQFHTGAQPTGGGRAAIFHGQGRPSDQHKQEIEQFFRDVDEGVAELIDDPERPVILACVEFLAPIFRDVNKHLNVLDYVVTGNPDHKKTDELHADALETAAPYFDSAERELREALERTAQPDRTLFGVEDVLRAAEEGRVEGVLADCSGPVWGRRNGAYGKVNVHEKFETEDDDLLDLAIAEAVRTGAEVHAVEPDMMPDGSARIAGLLRF